MGLWYPQRKRLGILRSSFAASNERSKILYIRYRGDLGEKTVGEILVTTDMVRIYPNIFHIEGLEVLRKQYYKVPTEDIIEMAKNVLKKVFLSLISNFCNKYVEPLLVLKLLPPQCDCIFTDFIETEFLKTRPIKLSVYGNDSLTIYFLFGQAVKK